MSPPMRSPRPKLQDTRSFQNIMLARKKYRTSRNKESPPLASISVGAGGDHQQRLNNAGNNEVQCANPKVRGRCRRRSRSELAGIKAVDGVNVKLQLNTFELGKKYRDRSVGNFLSDFHRKNPQLDAVQLIEKSALAYADKKAAELTTTAINDHKRKSSKDSKDLASNPKRTRRGGVEGPVVNLRNTTNANANANGISINVTAPSEKANNEDLCARLRRKIAAAKSSKTKLSVPGRSRTFNQLMMLANKSQSLTDRTYTDSPYKNFLLKFRFHYPNLSAVEQVSRAAVLWRQMTSEEKEEFRRKNKRNGRKSSDDSISTTLDDALDNELDGVLIKEASIVQGRYRCNSEVDLRQLGLQETTSLTSIPSINSMEGNCVDRSSDKDNSSSGPGGFVSAWYRHFFDKS